MNTTKLFALLITSFFLLSCSIAPKLTTDADPIQTKLVKTGFNQNFSMLPQMNEELYLNIQKLKPQILRYPGGTVSHNWDWKNGVIETRKPKAVHKIEELKKLVEYTNAKFVIVLDILNKSLTDQIQMLQEIEKLQIPIEYIELGNELYAQDDHYKNIFPTGKEYADRVNQWIPSLRKHFPNAKIGALLLGRKVRESNDRMYHWNRQVVDNTINTVDAYTYHIYINENATFLEEKEDFITVSNNAKTKQKELWITEYGNKQDKSIPSYYTELNDLADFVENYPNVTIALNHQIIDGTKNKLTDDGKNFVEEGLLYLKRVAKQP